MRIPVNRKPEDLELQVKPNSSPLRNRVSLESSDATDQALLPDQHLPSALVIPGSQRIKIQTAGDLLTEIVPAIPVDCLSATFVDACHTMPHINRADNTTALVIDVQPDRSVRCQTIRYPRFGIERIRIVRQQDSLFRNQRRQEPPPSSESLVARPDR